MKIALGYDVHRLLKSDKPLLLGGINIDSEYSTVAHSDGDCLAHSLIDAIAPLFLNKNIGEIFSDTDDKNKGADSMKNLAEVYRTAKSPKIVNIDIVVQSDEVMITPYAKRIAENVEKVLNLPTASVSIKGKRTEGIYATSLIQVWAVVLFA